MVNGAVIQRNSERQSNSENFKNLEDNSDTGEAVLGEGAEGLPNPPRHEVKKRSPIGLFKIAGGIKDLKKKKKIAGLLKIAGAIFIALSLTAPP